MATDCFESVGTGLSGAALQRAPRDREGQPLALGSVLPQKARFYPNV